METNTMEKLAIGLIVIITLLCVVNFGYCLRFYDKTLAEIPYMCLNGRGLIVTNHN